MGEKKRNWQSLFDEATEELNAWRREHRKATFNDIESTIDEKLARVRAQMMEDLALESGSQEWAGKPAAERPKCPACGAPLQSNGEKKRQLTTEHEQAIELRRNQGRCAGCGATLFPPG